MQRVPNFTTEELQKLEAACNALSTSLAQANVRGEGQGNPLKEEITSILAEREKMILESPIFYQALFISADKGLDHTLTLINDIRDKCKPEKTDD